MLRFNQQKKIILATAWILFGFPLMAQERLTLSEVVARTLENNPDLAVDAPGQEAARLEFKAAKAGYLPRLDFEQSDPAEIHR
jgi:outer membrane protein TolC